MRICPTALAQHLGRSPAPVAAARLGEALAPIAAGGAPWVLGIVDEMVRHWSRGETSYRLAPSATDMAKEFVALLASISTDRARGLDVRSFALKVTGDTSLRPAHA